MPRRRPSLHPLSLLVLLVAVLALAACGGAEDAAEPAAEEPAAETEAPAAEEEQEEEAAPAELTEVSYATSFGTFGRDAYAHVALEQGFFEDEGFDVSIVPGSGSVDNAKLIAAGRLDYAPLDFNALVVTRGNEGIPVKIVSFVHQQALTTIMAKADSGISEPQDLEGKTIADTPGSTGRVMFPLYADRAGVDADQVQFRAADAPSLPALLASGRVDAVGQFVVGRPLFEKATGGELVLLPYAEYLSELPGIGIAASDEKIASSPDEVERFVRAINRGLQYAIENPEEAAAILKQHEPEIDEEVAAQELEIMAEYVTPEEGSIGTVDEERLAAAIDVIGQVFELENDVTVDDVWAPGFVGEGGS